MEQFKLKRMWEDGLEMEVVLTLKGKWCEVTVDEYVPASDIDTLISTLSVFNVHNGKSPQTWTLDVPQVHVSLTFELANGRGTVQVNAVVEQMKGDGGDMKATFSFETTMGQMDDLQRQLSVFLARETDLVESLRPE
ncbi:MULTISPECIES: hypothetical protein [unclassified Exiguobacterium]|uniref:hypothetical protein n=1 Tax=unclassified Exiguobacterium TaxID=2644629 RepID=UPI00103F052E|nr:MULTISPECIES: hypothetical protein [unclassified Exiguobacterium]TCI69668.1 hypothetical protein EVJ19_08575 [Exiguobacterium sp. IPCI3]TCI78966.1 hypothetical protein EVJ18_08575 [Exiguobacterium sp. IPCH1]TCI81553.1 hypothetical protein EVJ17_08575 [Exiguobacterium sp. IPBC4]